MTKLIAKVLTITFLPEKLEESFLKEEEYDCEAWEFENGLIVIPEVHTADSFYPSRKEIEGYGNDRVVYGSDQVIAVTETENTQVVTTTELIDSYQQFLTEFDCQLESQDCSKLVDSLTTKPMPTKMVDFFFTAKSMVTLELTEKELKTLLNKGDKDLYYEVIDKAYDRHQEKTKGVAPSWEMDTENDNYFQIIIEE